ncbi:enoyl-CoA hydratase-related protein [Dehalococcoidia bacterium]|nr:enoyl-CoA hydratase-related protein [Dehalococcoidia bacterium]
MAYRNLILEKKDHIGYITLNRPQEGNAIDRALADELAEVCARINEEEEIRVVVITGSDEVFSSGNQAIEPGDFLVSSVASTAVAGLKTPVVAAINGDALGAGLELALAGDIRLAAEGARFGLPQVAYGALPAGGGTQRLPRIVGRGKALEMILTAAVVDAQEAYRIGLVNRVFSSGELRHEAESLASKLAAKGPIALQYAKEAINKGLDVSLQQGLGLEADLSIILQSTADREEGIRAFLEKRGAQFRGK